ncbi:MAG: protein kinase [Acidobacteriota bacterium]
MRDNLDSSVASDQESLVGRTLGRYHVDARLGAGGMGVVYRAHDQLLQRDVAVKVLSSQSDAAGRLLQEARSVSALNHPNICTVHEIGEHDGHTFIVMEFIDGEPLSARVERGPLETRDVLRIGEQIADALIHAHGRGVIHRDLKCANVVDLPDQWVKVLDFGIAVRPATAAAETATHIADEPGVLNGTLAYMSPEVLRGEPADPQSEIWSVGVMLYELCAGRRPFAADSAFALVAAIVGHNLKPLPAAVPSPLAAVIVRCLARERRERYQNARELKAVLQTARQALTSGRHTLTDLSAVAARRMESVAVLPLANRCAEPGQDFFVDGMTDALIAELSRVQALRVISRTSVMRYRDTTKTAPEIAAELGVDAIVEGSVMTARGIVRVQAQLIDASADRNVWSGSYDRPADDVFALHSDVAKAIVADLRVKLSPEEQVRLNAARPMSGPAHDLWLKGRYLQNKAAWTLADYQQALAYYEQSVVADPSFAPAYVGQADICHRLGGYGFLPPAAAFGRAKLAAERALMLDDQSAAAHSAVAFSRWLNDWDYAAALAEYERAQAFGNDEQLHQHGSLLSLMGRHDEAVARYLHAAAVNPFNTDVRWGMGMAYRMGGWADRAVESLRSWLLIEPNDMQASFHLALALGDIGQFAEAEAILVGMAAIPQLKGLVLGPLAYMRGRAGRRDEARAALDELGALAAAGYPVQGWLAVGWMGLGDHANALAALSAAVSAHEAWMPTWMNVDPAFTPLHGHPEFTALLRATGHAA